MKRYSFASFEDCQQALRLIYASPELRTYPVRPIDSPRTREVYGTDLCFPDSPEDRPYTYASFVNSIDGRLAFADAPSAFYVAAKNNFAGPGTHYDFWILNMLRTQADAAVIGGNSMGTDEGYLMSILDQRLYEERRQSGLPEIPLNIVMTLDGRDVPLGHSLLHEAGIPRLLVSTPGGLDYVRANYSGELKVCDEIPARLRTDACGRDILPIFVCGDQAPDNETFLREARKGGIQRLLIESPTYSYILIRMAAMDEYFLNRSGIYIGGGDTMVFGKSMKGFPSTNHPHLKLLSMAIYNAYFTYSRYRFDYRGFIPEV